jgi:heavy metal sensor kinase
MSNSDPSSLRRRLLLRAAGALAILFALAAGAMYLMLRASLLADFDAALASEASALASLAEQDTNRIKIELEPGELPEFRRDKRPHYFQIWDQQGNTVGASASLAQKTSLPRPDGISTQPIYQNVRLPSGKRGRMIAYLFKPRFEDETQRPTTAAAATTASLRTVAMTVARPTHDLDETLDQIAITLTTVSAAAIVVSILLLALVIGQGLRPLGALATSIERVGIENLSDRIRVESAPRELTPVVQRLNDLLARLEAAMTREKSFTADVAHELRTPLAGLSSTLEVCASRPRESAEYQHVVARCLAITRSLESMVNNLLLLARADAKQLVVESSPMQLGLFLRECWSPFEPRAAERRLDVQWMIEESGGGVCADRDKLRIVLGNVFDNAVTYADDGGRVRIEAWALRGKAHVKVTNTGSQLTPAEAAKVFDRFWRGDESRAATGTHCGLGLTLCRKVMDVIGGSIEAESDGTNFVVTLRIS